MKIRLCLLQNTFHFHKIKPYVEKDSINFLSHYEEQLGEVAEGRWDVEGALEFRTAPCASKSQCLVSWKGYGSDDDEWINFENISLEIIQDSCTRGNYSITFQQQRLSKKYKKR